jgi:6-phospho-beta-glucosidase
LKFLQAEVVLESVGLNHATWSTRFLINGEDGIKVMIQNLDKVLTSEGVSERVKRQFRLASEYERLPNSYLQYYYYREQTVAEAQASPKTRAQIILDMLPGYYQHFKEQIAAENPRLTHVRGGSLFGDMAVDVISSLVLQDSSIHTLNVPNRGALPGFERDRVVEIPARIEKNGATPLVQDPFPSEIMGLLHMLADYQWLAAHAIWEGDRRAIEHALAANPLVLSLSTARNLLEDIFALQAEYFPSRLLE